MVRVRRFSTLSLLAIGLAAPGVAPAAGLEGLAAGVNGLLTAPADPIAYLIEPPEYFDEVPLPQLSGRVLGVVSGTMLAAKRAGLDVLDIALTPLWVVPTLSPE